LPLIAIVPAVVRAVAVGYPLDTLLLDVVWKPVCVGAVLAFLYLVFTRWALTRKDNPAYQHEFVVELSAEGLQVTRPGVESALPWSSIPDIQSDTQSVYFLFGDNRGQAVPRRCIGSEEDVERFIRLAKEYAAGYGQTDFTPTTDPDPASQTIRSVTFTMRIRDAFRLARFLVDRRGLFYRVRRRAMLTVVLLGAALIVAGAEFRGMPVARMPLSDILPHLIVSLAGIAGGIVCYAVFLKIFGYFMARNPLYQRPFTVALRPAGIYANRAGLPVTVSWDAVIDVAEDRQAIYLVLGPKEGFIVPKNAFHSSADASDFLATARALRAREPVNRPAQDKETWPPAPMPL
jgi:hypothetical protein